MTNYSNEYTDNEKKLLRACGVDNDKVFEMILPIPLYQSVAIECFKLDITGPHINALKRALNMLESTGPIYRHTKIFEKGIEFD